MGESGGFNGENIDDLPLPGGSFSRLLLSTTTTDGDTNSKNNESSNSTFYHMSSHPHHQPSPLFSSNTPKMLCFGDFGSETTPFPSSLADSSVSSSGNSLTFLTNKRRGGSGRESGLGSGNGQNDGKKKTKPEVVGPTLSSTTMTTTSVGHAKGRREKLGERITVLQQLVCPFGKTDTASVLHEAMGYIRFLQDQVKVLSAPYLCLPSSSTSPRHTLSVTEKSAPSTKVYDSTRCLKSRGLCLVPVECIVDIANNNGADFWSSATS